MIRAEKINEIIERKYIDVVVQFTERQRSIDITKTFNFKNREEIILEYECRIENAIDNIESGITKHKEPTPEVIINRIDEHFIGNRSLNQTQYESIKTTELVRGKFG